MFYYVQCIPPTTLQRIHGDRQWMDESLIRIWSLNLCLVIDIKVLIPIQFKFPVIFRPNVKGLFSENLICRPILRTRHKWHYVFTIVLSICLSLSMSHSLVVVKKNTRRNEIKYLLSVCNVMVRAKYWKSLHAENGIRNIKQRIVVIYYVVFKMYLEKGISQTCFEFESFQNSCKKRFL